MEIDFIRKTKQLFESLYWYRWKKGRGGTGGDDLLLPDCWNGDWSIYNVMLRKLEHCMWAYRKYSPVMERYLDFYMPSEINSLETVEKKYGKAAANFLKKKAMEKFAEIGVDHDFYIDSVKAKEGESSDGRRSFWFTKKDRSIILYTSVRVLLEPGTEEYKHYPSLYEWNSDKKDFVPVKPDKAVFTKLLEISDLENPTYEQINRLLASTVLPEEVRGMDAALVILGTDVIELEPKDLKEVPLKLKRLIRGSREAYHSMWEFRRFLKKVIAKSGDALVERMSKEEFLKGMSLLYDYGTHWWY